MIYRMTRFLTLLCVSAFGAHVALAGQHGDAMPEHGLTLSLAEAIGAATEDGRYEGKIRGRITEVCKKKGCFMVLTDGDHAARVVFKDYGFFVPKDTPPGMSTVFGELSARTLTAEEANHMAEDAGRAPTAEQAVREYQIVASAVMIE